MKMSDNLRKTRSAFFITAAIALAPGCAAADKSGVYLNGSAKVDMRVSVTPSLPEEGRMGISNQESFIARPDEQQRKLNT